jgi:hypothetical protein
MKSSRRAVLAGIGVAAGAATFEGRFGASALAQTKLAPGLLRSEREVFADVEWMNSLGPRYCGNKAHMTLIQFLEDELVKCGLTLSSIHNNTLQQWLPRNVTLKSKAGSLPVGAFCRWAQQTGPQGVTAPLHYVGEVKGASRFDWTLYPDKRSKLPIPADVKGKIALVEINAGKRPLGLMFDGQVRYMFDKDQGQPFPDFQGPSASNMAFTPDGFEENLRKAGAVGLIYAWNGLADEDAQGQSRLGTEHLPSLWVVPTTGTKLKAMAKSGEPVTLTVEADTQANAPTRTIVATLPGMSEESIILWSHTDGPNALQENGHLAILNMVRYLSKLPKTARKRTITVVIPEGHFAEQYVPTSAWIKQRPELVQKAVALIAAEHLGGTEWLSDPVANTYKPSGKHEIAFAFCPSAPMQALAKQAVQDQPLGREAIIGTDKFSFTPGIAAWRQTKLPSFAYISIPSYLMADSSNGHIAKLDPKLYYAQVQMLLRLVHAVDATPTELLRQV